ncbi:MAG: DUF4105 domain-containing protein [Odoribacteraceae bacterium]|nr:DUF4105 domain-containing protein [Odoribacteraceae bacterium]
MMRFTCLLLVASWFFPASGATSPGVLSGKAEVSLLTCAPGDQLYSLFGHTAIRVRDPGHGVDEVFNYGTFDFATRGFYFKFASGTLLYRLSRETFPRFMAEYYYQDREVQEQVLRLDSLQRQRLWEMLEENSLPGSRDYFYNFLFDNCTTRARDVIAVIFDGIAWEGPGRRVSFWEQLDEYLSVSPWTRWGIHTILGSPATAEATVWEQMFLPDYLARGAAGARVDGQLIASPARVLHGASRRETTTAWYFSPAFVFAVCAAGLALLARRRGVAFVARLAVPFFMATGLLGCLLVFLGYFTLHPTTAPNANLLWANPANLVVAFFIARERIPAVIRGYLRGYIVLLVVALISWVFLRPAVVLSSMIIIAWMGYLSCRVTGASRAGRPRARVVQKAMPKRRPQAGKVPR